MNPPSALYGAMNKERKPFTYTPGGLDLSEIKSERMAKRLMRNAMSEGVSETPTQTLQSPPTPIAPSAIPNFNCLPVQVFPTFALPANPKSLLRTRSISDAPKETPTNFIHPASKLPAEDKFNTNLWKDVNKPSLFSIDNNSNISNNNRPTSMYEYDYKTITDNPSIGFKNQDHTEIFLPEKCYDVEFCETEPQGRIKVTQNKNNDDILQSSKPNIYGTTTTTKTDNNISVPLTLASLPLQDIDASNNYEQKEVKVVKKQSKTENKSEQNGDTETALVVKLPKSSAAKTETKVEVLKKILPDGTIEEIKTTTTKTTKDGKTEITTETETRTIPKEGAEEVIEVEEEEEEEESENVIIEENGDEEVAVVESKISNENEIEKSTKNEEDIEETQEEVTEAVKTDVTENGDIITGEEKIESSTTKKIVVTQTGDESEEEVEEEEVEEDDGTNVDVEEVVILRKPESKQNEEKNESVQDTNVEKDSVEPTTEKEPEEQEEEIEEEEENEEEIVKTSVKEAEKVEKEDEDSEIEETPVDENNDDEDEGKKLIDEDLEEEYEEAEDTQLKEEVESESNVEKQENDKTESQINEVQEVQKTTETTETSTNNEDNIDKTPDTKLETDKQKVSEETVHKIPVQLEPKVSFREPSIPLEKVEDVEIKPIGPAQEIIKKSHTEIITTTTDKPAGALSTQTEYNRIENIVTVNRTTKTLDAYEPSQPTIPTLKTYFSPINDRVLSTPQPTSRPYQPVYPPEPQTERRHSLLLERLSVERQAPPADYSIYNNQSYEQNQWSEEPQSEVLTVSNVKPSTITKNQQWYQQTKRENVIPNIVSPSPIMPSQQQKQQPQQQWGQSYQQPYNQPQPQIQIQPEPQYQTYAQPQYTPKPEYQPYIEKSTQNTYKSTNDLQQNVYPTYTPKPSWVSSTFDSKPANLAPLNQSNQYSSFKKDSTESYQKSTQQFSSSYVPPPWEQDSSYITESQNYYQPPPPSSSFTPSTNQSWKPQTPTNKFSKAPPTSYIPPAPNQSFVKPVTSNDQSKVPGRKTYYSEYERRYISVPESTYIPSETKFQPQPDPSPQYYYDNNEPVESVEPQWRKELREFTEKTSETTTQYEKTSVNPPWEEDTRYAAPADYAATTPSWTQTLRPRTWRERSYEPEYIGSKEWPKTNTLGRGRPQSSYIKSNVETIQERPRGVSVDRYNPNNYQSPLSSEHPPVQSHTLNPTIHPKTYHNPNVPGYHARASAEPREQVTTYPRRVESKAPPVQSRSFKYLQWITGTED